MKKNAEMFLSSLDRRYKHGPDKKVAKEDEGYGYCLSCPPRNSSGYHEFTPINIVLALLVSFDIDPNDFTRAIARVRGETIADGVSLILWLKHECGNCGINRGHVCRALDLL